jgi:hypothetical protein
VMRMVRLSMMRELIRAIAQTHLCLLWLSLCSLTKDSPVQAIAQPVLSD